MEKLFDALAHKLQSLFEDNEKLRENELHYTLFALMLEQGIEPDDVIVGFPHPHIELAKIDAWLPAREGHPVAIELQYDPAAPDDGAGEVEQTSRFKMGAVFEGLRRLAILREDNSSDNYFIHVVTRELASHIGDPANRLEDFFNLPVGESLRIDKDWLSPRKDNLSPALGDLFAAKIESLKQSTLPKGHELHIYKVSVLQD